MVIPAPIWGQGERNDATGFLIHVIVTHSLLERGPC